MKRRHFIIKSSVVTAALSTSNLVLGKVFNSSTNENLNIGIIGTGERACALIPILNKIPNFNISACCDILPTQLNKAILLVDGNPETYKDYRKLLLNTDLDAVVITTPFSSHAQITADAIATKKHVFCESTIAKGYEGISSVLATARTSNKIIQVGHQYRSSILYSKVKSLIENNKIGNIRTIDCSWNVNGDWRRPVSDANFERLINWRMYREFSGGLLAEHSSHQIDFTNWILNATPLKAVGTGANNYWQDDREIFDNLKVTYSYPNNVQAQFTCSASKAQEVSEIKITGDKGTIIIKNDGVLLTTPEKNTPLVINQLDPSEQALLDFHHNIIENKLPNSNIETASKTAICVQMGLDAILSQRTINWNTNLGV